LRAERTRRWPTTLSRAITGGSCGRPAGADHPRDPTSHPCRWCIPGPSLGADASGCEASAHSLDSLGTTALHGDGEFAKSNSRGGGGLTTEPSDRYRKSERSVELSSGREFRVYYIRVQARPCSPSVFRRFMPYFSGSYRVLDLWWAALGSNQWPVPCEGNRWLSGRVHGLK